MASRTIAIGKKKVKVEANASTLLVYEDRFKGRRLLQDIDYLVRIKSIEKVPFSLYSKLLWATAKTADESTPDVYEWTKNFEINEIISASQVAVGLICESIETSKKEKATAGHRLISRLMTFFRMR